MNEFNEKNNMIADAITEGNKYCEVYRSELVEFGILCRVGACFALTPKAATMSAEEVRTILDSIYVRKQRLDAMAQGTSACANNMSIDDLLFCEE